MKYTINLVREIRLGEKREEAKRVQNLVITGICFGVLAIALFYCVLAVLQMQFVLMAENKNLQRIEAEYNKYQATKMFVDRADIELLDNLQNSRIFWTKKLASLAYHLPQNYWITKFNFDGTQLKAYGYGYISYSQEQLVVLNKYFNDLRVDSLYNDNFSVTFFDATERRDEKGQPMRVSFEFTSTKR